MKRVIIYGHKLYSHTHSYIHYAFHKAFRFMGYETHWVDKNDDIQGLLSPGTIFLTEGQADENIPKSNDYKYILHNCNPSFYEHIKEENILKIQVYTNDVLNYGFEKVGNHLYYKDRLLYLYWGTDLLPHEIEYRATERENFIYWVGTVGDGQFGNIDQLLPFIKGAILDNKPFMHKVNLSFEESEILIRKSYLAPAINGQWQVEKGYIPCRIFKNISYAQIGLTNNQAVSNLFNGEVLYSPDTLELFDLGKQALHKDNYKDKVVSLMNVVKNEHTYVNRINTILKFL